MSQIVLKGQPLSTNNIYRHTGHRVYMTKQGKELKEDYQWQAKMQWKKKPLTGEIGVSAVLYFKDKRKHDLDNMNKLWIDSLQDIVFVDDSQIQSLYLEKQYDKADPRIIVEIY